MSELCENYFTIKHGQLNGPRWRSKPLLVFAFYSTASSLPVALSLPSLSVSFSLPHSLFEEVRCSFSLLFFSYSCRRAATALNIIVGGGCDAAVRLWEVLRSWRGWLTAGQANRRCVYPLRCRPVSCCWSIFAFPRRVASWDQESLYPHKLISLLKSFFLKYGIHRLITRSELLDIQFN